MDKSRKIKMLLVEDDPGDALLLREYLSESRTFSYEIAEADRVSKSLELLELEFFDVIILDLNLPDSRGIETFSRLNAAAPMVPIIVLTGLADEEIGTAAVKQGAQDYLVKGQADGNLLSRSIIYSIERKQSEEELKKSFERLKETLSRSQVAEEALRESERKYRHLFEELTDAAILINADTGIIVDTNRKAEELFGRKRSELAGSSILTLHPAEKREEYRDRFIEQVKTGKAIEQDGEVVTKNGTAIPVMISATAIELGGEKLVLVLFRDLTERKRMEQELVKAQKLESIGVLAGGIAHDLNNLLTTIMGNIELADMETKPGGEGHERLKEAERAILRTRELSRQLLTFSTGGSPVKKTIDLCEVVEDSVSLMLSAAPGIECDFKCEEGLWAVDADAGQISQVLNNLLLNALQSMPEGGRIWVICRNLAAKKGELFPLEAGRYVELTVKDSGEGIPPENMGRIFDPYFTTRKKGSGLGLAIVYSIVKGHEGHIQVESEVNLGTTFRVYLPATISAPVIKEEAAEVELPKGKRVLFMDDEEGIRELVGRRLAEVGFAVSVADSGEKAVDLFKRAMDEGDPFDAVIMDLVVPGAMGGKEAIKEIRKMAPAVRAIVSSGYSADQVMANYGAYGFKAAIEKPYRISELVRLIGKVIREKESGD